MSDTSWQEYTPPGAANPPFPPQEFFGPPFPENPLTSSPMHPLSAMQPGQAPGISNSPFASIPSPLGVPLISAYPGPARIAYAPAVGIPALPRPLALAEALRHLPRQYWNVLTHPKAATFAWEQGKAAWNSLWSQLLLLAIVETLVVLALLFLESFLIQLVLPSDASSFISQALPLVALFAFLFCMVLVPISFFFGAGILHLVAKAFGGQGAFLPYAYSYALITIPIGILSLLLSLIPCLGSIAQLAGCVYAVVLLVYMTMGVHRLSGGRAAASVLIPIGIGVLLLLGAYVAYFIWLFSLLPALPATR